MCSSLQQATTNLVLAVTKDDGKKKPTMITIKMYDIGDHKIEKSSKKPRLSKRTVDTFSDILDIASVNPATLSKLNQEESPKTRSNILFLFGWNSTISLSNGLQKHTQNTIAEILGIKIERPSVSPEKIKRYLTCLDQIDGVDHEKKKDALGKPPIDALYVVKHSRQAISRRFAMVVFSKTL